MKSGLIDITHIPFSRYGAYLSVTRDEGKDGEGPAKKLVIHSVRRRFEESPLFELTFGAEGEEEDFTCSADPEALTVENEHGSAVLWIRDDDTLGVESRGLDLCLRLRHWGYGTETGAGTWRMISGTMSLYSSLAVEKGSARLDGPYHKSEAGNLRDAGTRLRVRCEEGRALLAVTVRHAAPKEPVLPILPEEEIAAARAEWDGFLSLLPKEPAEAGDFPVVTWYNLWSSFVRAEGIYRYDTMLMAKKSMSSTWSWDHCFNALAMAHLTDPQAARRVAMDQFSAPFWLQNEGGVLPDMWNPDLEIRWGTTKPPIHGWCFGLLMDRFGFDRDTLTEVYGWLESWTRWWTETSDTDGDGIPDYPQGCDSGWDNSTLFDAGYFMETPDLPAFLVLQMKTLARIADKLASYPAFEGKAAYWNAEADAMLARLIAHSWDGERFVAKKSGSHESEAQPTSLLSLMPLVLGELLPKDIRDKLALVLERDFLTDNGLATEMPQSPKYRPDGYWRGPIWAPSTYLLVDGLRRGGYDRLARTVAERYCRMSAERAKGNYENFDALSGMGHRAPGYTWSASVYMLLHWEYGR